MRSVADDLRKDLRRLLAALSAEERIHLALRLGEDDLELFVQSSGLSRPAALQRLRTRRSIGRSFSRVARSGR